jgi:hypothetical protein
MKPPRTIVTMVMWFTRVGGAIFVVGGLGFFVSAWVERSIGLISMGAIAIAFGLFIMSIRATPGGSLEYGLFRAWRSLP